MVNRVLIRIKVVQMLYSYLLTRSEFKINEAPETTSRDRRYAHAVYIDLLLLLLELSGYSAQNGKKASLVDVDRKLGANKVARALSTNDAIRAAILKGNSHIEAFQPALQKIHDKITASKVYTDYAKKAKTDFSDDVMLWTTLLETTIASDPSIEEVLRAQGGYSNHGFELGIRDAVDTLKSYADARELLNKAKKDLTASLDKAYELYLYLFGLIIDITDEQERRLENAKGKFLASSADRNPNTQFIDNKLVAYLKDHEQLADLMKEYKVSRAEVSSPLIRSLLDNILDSELYAEYLKKAEGTLEADAEFWRDAMRNIVLPSNALVEELEDMSVYWNDDLQIMGTFVLKTLRQIAQSKGRAIEFLPKYKDEEDEKFGPELFMLSVKNQEEYRKLIDRFINAQWDPERLAYMDIVIMTVAIAEIINYPAIPVPVTVNEYVDIANGYSSDKSGGFINGILFSVIKYLNEQGVIHKM